MLIRVNGTPRNTSGCSTMPNRIHAAQVCDARDDDSSNAVDKIIILKLRRLLRPCLAKKLEEIASAMPRKENELSKYLSFCKAA